MIVSRFQGLFHFFSFSSINPKIFFQTKLLIDEKQTTTLLKWLME